MLTARIRNYIPLDLIVIATSSCTMRYVPTTRTTNYIPLDMIVIATSSCTIRYVLSTTVKV